MVVGELGCSIPCCIAKLRHTGYDRTMKLIRIRFPDQESKRRALGFLAGRFSFTSYASEEVLVVESALTALAVEGLSFTVEGPATYAESIPAFRTPPAHQVQ
jgi:hypothetical protein